MHLTLACGSRGFVSPFPPAAARPCTPPVWPAQHLRPRESSQSCLGHSTTCALRAPLPRLRRRARGLCSAARAHPACTPVASSRAVPSPAPLCLADVAPPVSPLSRLPFTLASGWPLLHAPWALLAASRHHAVCLHSPVSGTRYAHREGPERFSCVHLPASSSHRSARRRAGPQLFVE